MFTKAHSYHFIKKKNLWCKKYQINSWFLWGKNLFLLLIISSFIISYLLNVDQKILLTLKSYD